MRRELEPYLLYLGAVLDEASLAELPAASPAANRWQLGLLGGLRAIGRVVRPVGSTPEQLWPRGKAWVGARDVLAAPTLGGELVGYLNAPMVRNASQHVRLAGLVRRYMRRYGAPLAALSYNTQPSVARLAGGLLRRAGVPWVPIIADVDVRRGGRRTSREALARYARGAIYLSWGSYEAATTSPKLHLDGGVDALPTLRSSEILPKTILYSGTMTKYGGVSLLIDAFRRVNNPNARLWICGKGPLDQVARAARSDPRVDLLGYLSREELELRYRRAAIFVNPRPSSLPENQHNFPSKLLEYLAYAKPVVSTWTGGLSPEYREVLEVPEDQTPEALARSLERVLGWSDERLGEVGDRVANFVAEQRLWPAQALRLDRWITREVETQ